MEVSIRKITVHPVLLSWIIAGWLGLSVFPWYGIENGFFNLEWFTDGYPFYADYAPALFLIMQGEKIWLAPLLLPLIFCCMILKTKKTDSTYSIVLIICGGFGFAWLIAQGFSIGINGWNFKLLSSLFGELEDRQFGMGYGALLLASSYLFLFTHGVAARGAVNGDVFVVSAITAVITIVCVFVFFPILNMLLAAFITQEGLYSASVFFSKLIDNRLWGLSCLAGQGHCGVAWNSLFFSNLSRVANNIARTCLCTFCYPNKFSI